MVQDRKQLFVGRVRIVKRAAHVFAAFAVLTVSLSASARSATGSVTNALPAAGISYHLSSQQVSVSAIRAEAVEKAKSAPVTGTKALSASIVSVPAVAETIEITEAKELTPAVESADSVREAAQARVDAGLVAPTPLPAAQVTEERPLTSLAAQEVLGSQRTAEGASVQEPADTQTAAGETEVSGTAVARVTDFVNVREAPDIYAEAVGKMHSNAVGTILETAGEWYKVESGSVTGYVKAEFLATGAEAESLLPEIAATIATVSVDELNVRAETSTDSEVLARVSMDEKLTVVEELEEWVRVSINGEEGYLYKEYVSLVKDYIRAESRAEEEARIARAAELEQARLQQAAAEAQANPGQTAQTKSYQPAEDYVTAYSDKGSAVVAFALQFVGNPYVWGGTSLTNGCDCSGFTMSVYANFGVSITHASDGQAYVGYPVDGLENAMPGDIISYPGHVALYIGDGQIVHASHPGVGIIVSSAYYTPAIAVRRIFIE